MPVFQFLRRFLTKREQTRPGTRVRVLAVKPRFELLETRLTPSSLPPCHFDFGTKHSPVADGYTQVLRAVFSSVAGIGWQSTKGLHSYSSDETDALTRDGIRGAGGTFLVNLPIGTYTVTATLGQSNRVRDDMAIFAQGDLAASGLTTTTQQAFLTISFDVNVTDGQLSLRFADQGGLNHRFALAALDIAISANSPDVNAGSDQAADEGTTVNFQGNSNTSGLTYDWDFGDGGTATGTLTPSHVYADNGTYTVTLTGTDGIGNIGSDTAVVTIANVAPSATLGNSGPVNEASPVTVTLSNPQDVSAADQSAGFTYSYDFDNDGTFDLVNVPAATVQHTYSDNGEFTLRARITDKDAGFTDYTTVVSVANTAPIATFSNNGPVGEGSTVTVSFSNQDDESADDMVAGFLYSYDLNNDGDFADPGDLNSVVSSFATISPSDDMAFTVRGRITDKDGGFTDSTTTVIATNVNPTATLSNNGPVNEGSPATFAFQNQLDPSAVDQAAGFTYSYDFDNDGTFDLVNVTSASEPYPFSDNGTFTVRGRISDKDGGFSEYTTVVNVTNAAPTATLSNTGPANEGSPVTIAFSNQQDASSVDQAAGFTYSYDFNNDGVFDLVNVANAAAPNTFSDDGSWTVRGRITDKDGGFTNYTTVATVANVAPTATFANNGPVAEGSNATFSFSNQLDPSTDDVAAGFRYSYDFNNDGDFTDPGELNNVVSASASFTTADNSVFTVHGRISDQDGGFTDYTTTLTVTNANPSASLSNNGPVSEGGAATVTFQNQQDPSSVDQAAGFRYSYDFDNDGTFDVVDVTTASATHAFPDNGSFTVRGRIKDKDGGFTDYTTVVGVNNVAPTASLTNNGPVTPGNQVSISFGSQSDPSSVDTAAGFRYSYDFNNDGVFDVIDSAVSSASTVYGAAGGYVVTGRIKDKDGGFTNYTTTVTVGALRTFYVATTGSDTNNGSQSSPWRTLQYASSQSQPGDLIIVQPGNYQGFGVTRSGTSTRQIMFQGLTGAVINQPYTISGNYYGINSSGKSYITIQGFTFAPQAADPEWYCAIRLGGTPGNWVLGNVILNNTCQMRVDGVSATPDKYGIYSSWNNGLLVQNNTVSGTYNSGIYTSNSAKNYTIRGNQVFNAGGNGIHNNGDLSSGSPGINYNALIENNIIHNVGFGIGGQAISCDGVQDSRIQNNLIYDAHSKGISLYAQDAAEGCKRDIVTNNTVLVAADGYVPLRMNEYSDSNTIYNNIFYAATANRAWVDVEEESTNGMICDYNVTTGVAMVGGSVRSDWQSTYGFDTHSVVSNPGALFVNATGNDYHLKAGSPAIDKGTSTLAPSLDLEGHSRPTGAGIDVGAYEFGSFGPRRSSGKHPQRHRLLAVRQEAFGSEGYLRSDMLDLTIAKALLMRREFGSWNQFSDGQ